MRINHTNPHTAFTRPKQNEAQEKNVYIAYYRAYTVHT